jgi:hypothetical protein
VIYGHLTTESIEDFEIGDPVHPDTIIGRLGISQRMITTTHIYTLKSGMKMGATCLTRCISCTRRILRL